MLEAKILLTYEEERLIQSAEEVAMVDYDQLRKAFEKVKKFVTEEQWKELKENYQFNISKNKIIIPEELYKKRKIENF